MQKIIVKMLRTDAIKKYTSQLFHILDEPYVLRNQIWISYTMFNPAMYEGNVCNLIIKFFRECQVNDIILLICKKEMFLEPLYRSNLFKMWETFTVVCYMIGVFGAFMMNIKKAEGLNINFM